MFQRLCAQKQKPNIVLAPGTNSTSELHHRSQIALSVLFALFVDIIDKCMRNVSVNEVLRHCNHLKFFQKVAYFSTHNGPMIKKTRVNFPNICNTETVPYFGHIWS